MYFVTVIDYKIAEVEDLFRNHFLFIVLLLIIISGCSDHPSQKKITNYSMLFKIDKKVEEKNDEGKAIYIIEGHNAKDVQQKFNIKLDKNVWNLTKEDDEVTYGISFDIMEGEKFGELVQIYRAPKPG
ncbi:MULTISPECIES: hypothetical protein [Pontibacillus]|uniref:DUF3221 domain-containing protein n=1 Tax=Pontibacillus chungwhensis TaxID=265426 RepID=A0ABY8V016_9BACI|nr:MULTISPECIES: hypothetical protein [Pontibacillus]WIF99079.1 hypothetical protein QNI29_05335 [Pontibacillus chungwhensis]